MLFLSTGAVINNSLTLCETDIVWTKNGASEANLKAFKDAVEKSAERQYIVDMIYSYPNILKLYKEMC